MNVKDDIRYLEQKLTGLLGKMSYKPYKKACTGKYCGYYDFGLEFEDGTSYFISLGREYYHKHLVEKVGMYQYYHDNLEYLSKRTKEVIERDNRQAAALGLSPLDFIELNLQNFKGSTNLFWIGVRFKQDGHWFWETETTFFYACRGVGINDEKSVDVYFDSLLNRPDGKLGGINEIETGNFKRIFLGYLRR